MSDPHAGLSVSMPALGRSLWLHRQLIAQMIRREVIGRYRGSVLGLAWSFFNPVLMLVVYTFVFSVVFKARWGLPGTETQVDFAIVLFVGMIIHGLFAECVNRAPSLILTNVNYVKKVIFPLEILPVVAMGSALFHTLVSLLVLMGAILLTGGAVSWTILFFPLVLLPLLLATMGIVWFLAALGVYLRDIAQIAGMATTILMFLSPVFYPISMLPEQYQAWMHLNPLTFIMEEARKVMIFGGYPDFSGWLMYLAMSSLLAWLGFAWFQKARRGFADVI
jgi:lipopolysaccharide transport system permease protein